MKGFYEQVIRRFAALILQATMLLDADQKQPSRKEVVLRRVNTILFLASMAMFLFDLFRGR